MNITRTFTRAQMDEWDLPGARGDNSPEILHREQADAGRWVSVYELVFRAPDDGNAYRVYYEKGLTEDQEDTDPWNDADEIQAVQVEQRQVTVTEWHPVGGAPDKPADGWRLTLDTLDKFVRALVNEVDYDYHKGYECGEEDGLDHYPELVAEAAKMLNAITAITS